jgi:hypothetical protein
MPWVNRSSNKLAPISTKDNNEDEEEVVVVDDDDKVDFMAVVHPILEMDRRRSKVVVTMVKAEIVFESSNITIPRTSGTCWKGILLYFCCCCW